MKHSWHLFTSFFLSLQLTNSLEFTLSCNQLAMTGVVPTKPSYLVFYFKFIYIHLRWTNVMFFFSPQRNRLGRFGCKVTGEAKHCPSTSSQWAWISLPLGCNLLVIWEILVSRISLARFISVTYSTLHSLTWIFSFLLFFFHLKLCEISVDETHQGREEIFLRFIQDQEIKWK